MNVNFVVTQNKSGSNFVSHLLNAGARDVVSGWEYLRGLTGYQIVKAAYGYYDGKYTTEQIKALLGYYSLRPSFHIDSGALSLWILDPILEVFPEAKFLHLTRDPRISIVSCFNHHDLYGEIFSNPAARDLFLKWCVANDKPWMFILMEDMMTNLPSIKVDGWNEMSSFEKNCVMWAEGHQIILRKLSANKNKYLRLRLEDLNEITVAAQLFEFFGYKCPDQSRFEKISKTRVNDVEEPMWQEILRIKRELKIPLLPRFQEWSKDQKQIFERRCGETAKALGYLID